MVSLCCVDIIFTVEFTENIPYHDCNHDLKLSILLYKMLSISPAASVKCKMLSHICLQVKANKYDLVEHMLRSHP